jgi:hypothetical protein
MGQLLSRTCHGRAGHRGGNAIRSTFAWAGRWYYFARLLAALLASDSFPRRRRTFRRARGIVQPREPLDGIDQQGCPAAGRDLGLGLRQPLVAG